MDNNSQDKKETSVLIFLSKPRIWIIIIIVVLAGFWLTSFMQNIEDREGELKVVDSEFRAMCEEDFGELAWMKMEPIKDGIRISEEACFGCMVDINNMICDKAEYEQWKAENMDSNEMETK